MNTTLKITSNQALGLYANTILLLQSKLANLSYEKSKELYLNIASMPAKKRNVFLTKRLNKLIKNHKKIVKQAYKVFNGIAIEKTLEASRAHDNNQYFDFDELHSLYRERDLLLDATKCKLVSITA